MAIANNYGTISVASQPVRRGLSTFGLRGIHFSPEGGGAGGSTGTVETPEQKAEREAKEKEDKENAFDPSTVDEKTKKYFEGLITTSVEAAVKETAEKTRTELLAQQQKEKLAADRKAAREKAEADGNTSEALRLEREQVAADRSEAEKLRAEAAKDKIDALKLKIATKHKLPDGWAERLKGTTEAEIEADAAVIAKTLPTHKVAETEGGNKGNSGNKEQAAISANRAVKRYVGNF